MNYTNSSKYKFTSPKLMKMTLFDTLNSCKIDFTRILNDMNSESFKLRHNKNHSIFDSFTEVTVNCLI